MKIRTIIVEDIQSYIDSLKIMLEAYAEIEVVATANNKIDAIEKISTLSPDLIFMDIQLEKNSGFDVLDECINSYKYVIFTTCHEEFALKGYKYNTVHYLLKPIDENMLETAVERVSFCMQNNSNIGNIENIVLKYSNLKGDKIFLPDKNVHHAIEIDSIIMIESDSSYSNIHTLNRRIKISKNLRYVEALLKNHNEFARVHRRYIVNINYISHLKRGMHSLLTLMNGHSIPISVNEKSNLFTLLGIKNSSE
jgi:two-component system LytT family response regulator